MTIGSIITARRTELGLTQMDLAAKTRKRDGRPVSPQYLCDIEKDRRSLPVGPVMDSLAEALEMDREVFYYFAGALPPECRPDVSHERIRAAFSAFREAVTK